MDAVDPWIPLLLFVIDSFVPILRNSVLERLATSFPSLVDRIVVSLLMFRTLFCVIVHSCECLPLRLYGVRLQSIGIVGFSMLQRIVMSYCVLGCSACVAPVPSPFDKL